MFFLTKIGPFLPKAPLPHGTASMMNITNAQGRCPWVHTVIYNIYIFLMMTSSNGDIFRVTGHLCREFTGPRWIPAHMPVTRSFDVFFDLRLKKRLSKQWWGWWFDTPSPLYGVITM